MDQEFEYSTITYNEDTGEWFKHVSLATFRDDCSVTYELCDPEQIGWSELNQIVDETLEYFDE